jgi:hypothetical protein
VRTALPDLAPVLTESVVLGVDVSSYQGASINWTAAHAAGIEIAYVQISQGTGVVNPDAQSQIEGARAAGISVGAYHLCYPNLNTPQAEWAFFASHLGSLPVNLPNMLDDEIEINNAWVLTWLGLSGPLTLHYSDESYLAALGNLGYRQWTARPGATGLYPGDYATQFASRALAGFPGNVDLDYFDPSIPTPTGAPDMFWIKDPGSPACYTFGGGYKCPIPDDPDLNDLIKAQVPELTGISQTYFNLIPIAGAAPPAPAPPAAPFVSLTLEGTMEDAGGGKFTFTGTGTPEG